MMEFYFNEDKCIENNIDINKVYDFLDEKIVEEGGMTKLDDGIYQGEGQQAFNVFGSCVDFSEYSWFMSTIEEWYWRVVSNNIQDRENCIEEQRKWEQLKGINKK